MSTVTIIGAGPAGLTTAYELSRLGQSSIILEADHQVGGISRTVKFHNYRFDIGGHRFFTKVPYIRMLWEEILGEDFLVRSRLSRIHYQGRFFDYPLKPFNALSNLGPVESFLVGLSYTRAKLAFQSEKMNFEEWISHQFGRRLYNIFFKTYSEKVWGIPCSEISADWAIQRIKNLSLREVVRNAVFGNNASSSGEIITTLIDRFHYPRLGPGMLWERCHRMLSDSGCETIFSARVERIDHHRGRVDRIYARTGTEKMEEFGGEHFVSSIPLQELILKLNPPPPFEILQAARQLRYRDFLTVVLIVKRENIFPDNWIYIHSPEIKMGRIQNYKNWSPAMVPDPSRTSLGLEYFLWETDAHWHWSSDRLIDFGINECSRLKLVDPHEVEDGTVVRMKKTYPVYDQKYHHSLTKLRRYMERFQNLQTIGRNGLHRYNNQDHSMLTGIYAARNILGADYDVWSVNTELEYHEENRTGDFRKDDRLIPKDGSPEAVHARAVSNYMMEIVFNPLDPLALGISIGMVSGLGFFLATAILLLKGGAVVGPNLWLTSQYFWGYKVTWGGAVLVFFEAGLLGFFLGQSIARLKNWGVKVLAWWLKRRSEVKSQQDILDKVM